MRENAIKLLLLLFLLRVQGQTVPVPNFVQPDEDACVQEPCSYPVRDRKLEPGSLFYILLHDVDTADEVTCSVSNIRCATSKHGCPGLVVYFLPGEQFSLLTNGENFTPDPGSITNGTLAARRRYYAESVIAGQEDKYYIVLMNRGAQSMTVDIRVTYQVADCLVFLLSLLFVPGLVLVLCMCIFSRASKRGDATARSSIASSAVSRSHSFVSQWRASVSVVSQPQPPTQTNAKQAALADKNAQVAAPAQDKQKFNANGKHGQTVHFADDDQTQINQRQRAKTDSEAHANTEIEVEAEENASRYGGGHSRQSSKSVYDSPEFDEIESLEDLGGSTNCCVYDPAQDPGPPPVPECCWSCNRHKLPEWRCFCGYPAEFWKRPIVSYSRWWRQQMLITWPWNPEQGEVLDMGSRQTYVLVVLLFNLLVLTLWSEFLMRANQTVSRAVPVVGQYLERYIGSMLFQTLFYMLFKPLLAVLFVYGPVWRQSESICWRLLGTFLTYTIQILFLALLGAVSYSTLLLFTQYRCSVLIQSLIVPFFCYEILKMCLAFGFIPLPLYFWLLNAFGPELEEYEFDYQHRRDFGFSISSEADPDDALMDGDITRTRTQTQPQTQQQQQHSQQQPQRGGLFAHSYGPFGHRYSQQSHFDHDEIDDTEDHEYPGYAESAERQSLTGGPRVGRSYHS